MSEGRLVAAQEQPALRAVPSTPPGATAVEAGLEGAAQNAGVACVLAGLVLVVLDAAIVNVALPDIARALNVSPAASIRTVTAYQVALVMGLLPSAALGESLGHHRVYAAGVAVFTGASALCALAPSLGLLVLARFVQGLGGSVIMALGVALLRRIVPQRRLGSAIGWNALAIAMASAAGPTLGALVLSFASWPWLFASKLPLGVLVLLSTRWLPHVAGTARKVDAVSVGLNAAAFGGLVLGAECLMESPGLSVSCFVGAAASATALVRRELPRVAPLVPFDLLRECSFRASVIASVCCFIGQGAAMVALPFHVQQELGQDALHAGLLITPWPLTVAAVGPWVGRLSQRVASSWLCVVGAALLAIGLFTAALWPLQGRPHAFMSVVALCGAGFGLFQVANNRNMLLSAPQARSGAAGGMQGTARVTGQTVGGILLTLLYALTSSALAPRLGLALAGCFTLLAALASARRVRPAVR